MFKLFDGYSTTIDKISRGTDDATDKIIKASRGTDELNNKLEATGASADIANNGLKKLVGTFLSLAAFKKGMDISDEYTNTAARLGLINDGLQTQLELQDKIFAAADRSRGSYSDMSDAVAKMGLLAGKAFGSNDELIAFTELTQKAFRLGNTDAATQQGAMRQLTQAMASGRLQGDEFVSIIEGAPMLANAIEDYMINVQKAEGTMKDWSAQGILTADVIKNALFMAGEDINNMFETLPLTFADVGNKISREALKAFGPVIEKVNNLINTDGFERIINTVIGGIYLLAGGLEWLVNIIIDGWDIIGPILGAIATVALVNIISGLWAMITPLLLQLSIWQIMYQPILPLIGAIALLIYSLNETGITALDVFGAIGGAIGWLIGALANAGIFIENSFISIFGVVESAVFGAINLIIKGVNKIIEALNKIPGVDIGSVGELDGYWSKKELIEFLNLSDMYKSGSDIGKNLYTGLSDKLSSYLDKFSLKGDTPFDIGDYLKGIDTPLTIEGTGKNNKVEVDMDDEDLKYLRDIAEREYVNKFSTATLAPKISIKFGDVTKEADADKVAGRIKKILQEEIAIAAEGAY